MFEESLPNFEKKIQKLISNYKGLLEKCSILEAEKSDLEHKHHELSETSGGKLQELENNFEKQNQQVNYLKEENSKLKNQIQEYETKIKTVSTKIDSIFEQIDDI